MGDTAPTPMLDIGPRIGCDVVNVVDVTRSIELFGRRYLDRTFTPHELQTCAGRRGINDWLHASPPKRLW